MSKAFERYSGTLEAAEHIEFLPLLHGGDVLATLTARI